MIEDPNFEAEKEKYENPIPSREYILSHIQNLKKPVTRKELIQAFKLTNEEQIEGLRRRLRAMERDAQLIYTRNASYDLPENMSLLVGTVIGHRDGFGFIKLEAGGNDLRLPPRQMEKYFHGDKVLVQPLGSENKERREGRIIKLIESRNPLILGKLIKDKRRSFVRPNDARLTHKIVVEGDLLGAEHEQLVMVELTDRPSYLKHAQGVIKEVLGNENDQGMEIEIALRNHELPHTFNARVQKQIRKLGAEVEEEDKLHRVDLRHLPLVTIDGEDARDFDDAVYCEKEAHGFRLWVAIADVSHYVRKGSALDEEALSRGTSVYFPSQVIPMLPEELSNGLCSLKPNVDRLAMVAEMEISDQGEMKSYQFYPAVIHSHARLIYDQVHRALEGEPPEFDETLMPHLTNLQSLYQVLTTVRDERGAIAFETVETQFLFNELGRIESIVPRHRNEAHKIIEECMILANVAAAKFIKSHKAHTLYRVHEAPSEEKLTQFKSYLSERGLELAGGLDPHPADYSDLLKSLEGRDDASLIQIMLLRSMRQAHYTPDDLGHFGLALENYAHFTSPIRRYPDLQLHRSIRYLLEQEKAAGKLSENWTRSGGYFYQDHELDTLGEQCSMCERRADEASRDVADWLKCEYMQQHIGDNFSAVVASVTSFGFFARLDELFIDGLVHVTSLPGGFYKFDPARGELIAEASRQKFSVGDKVQVKVAAVNMDSKQIDLLLVNEEGQLISASKGTNQRSGKPKREKSDKLSNKRVRKRKDKSKRK